MMIGFFDVALDKHGDPRKLFVEKKKPVSPAGMPVKKATE